MISALHHRCKLVPFNDLIHKHVLWRIVEALFYDPNVYIERYNEMALDTLYFTVAGDY